MDKAAPSNTITTGQLAARHGITLRALRFYDQKGLLSPARKGTSRLYSEADAEKLAVILAAVALGFTLAEIPALIANDGGYKLAISPEQARKQLKIMHARLIETETAVARLRTLAMGRSAA
jgi:DNA-binding transcriptional MerR regulator